MDKIDETQPVNRQIRAKFHRVAGYVRQTQVVDDFYAGWRLLVRRLAQLIWLLFGFLEALIGLRVILQLIAANPNNPLANLIYTFTDLFLWPFKDLTVAPSFNNMVLEIPAIIAIFVYALVGWLLVRLVYLFIYHPASRTVRTVEREQDYDQVR